MAAAKILIVDDRPENLLTLESLLDEPDVELVKANSGEEALAQILDHDFALVLLDVQMPGMDGYEVAELMRGNKKTKNIPIIFVTAEVRGEHHLFKGYECGAVDYLFKPLNTMVFQSKVGVFLDLFRQKDALRRKTVELDMKLVELEELQQQLEETNEQLLLLSITDGLTGLLNKRQFDVIFADEWNRALRNKSSLSLIMLDIDHFKPYNDTYGHALGDDCLIKVAHAISDVVKRDVDKVARVGGEEFAIILPGTDLEGAEFVAEKVRKQVEKLGIPHTKSSISERVTASVGASSTIPQKEQIVRDLIKTADTALYQAKTDGRNCCRSMLFV
ncbi:diguanylate cyclase [Pseudodesulfovibrio sp. zrk46]|uniref:diguanylate cyclase domain-containing protein n=1 Tax=Pseudodesulfovibrio sp. zrk46 TaxID=2725288 RepID=UPI001448AA13|nr:diguanylate cyclase [Pseudodesulfovibrio sp. zrk46]QJB57090.1 diguanylate cyclase [Pseudodesulfovibrio sp. zrk46]